MAIMQGYTRTYREPRTTYVNGKQTSQATGQLAYDTVFTVTGCGNGNFVDPTACSFTKTSRKLMSGTSLTESPTSSTFVIGPNPNTGVGQGVPPENVDLSTADNVALQKLYKLMREGGDGIDSQPTANGAVTMGESRETYRMIRNASKAAANVPRWAKKAVESVTRKGRIVGDLSKAWLSYQYGWRPLLSDIHALAEFNARHFRERTFEGRHGRKDDHYHRVKLGSFNSIYSTSTGFARGSVLYSVTCEVNDPDAFDASRLSALDPKRVAWELLPLSFVFDWFVDISGYLELQEHSLARGLKFKRGFKTVSRLNYYVCSLQGAELTGSTLNSRNYVASRRVATKVRTKLTGFPSPQFPTVRVGQKMPWQRVLSAGALTAVALGMPPDDPGIVKARRKAGPR